MGRPSRRSVIAAPLALLGAAGPEPLVLRAAAAGAGVLYGAAIEPQAFSGDPAFAALAAQQCGLLAAENALKWDALRPEPGRFDFAAADQVAAIARRLGVPMHGHALVWHEAVPAWVEDQLRRGDGRALLVEHIARVVGRYAGRIRSWDVVNEPVERNDGRPDGLRRSLWLQAVGDDYIELAIRTAHAADPSARLVLSDYGLEYDDIGWMVEKRGTMLDLLAELKRSGAPLHALGVQGHLLGDHPPAFGRGLARFLADVARLGLDIYVTELDVNDQHMPGDARERDRASAGIYGAFLRAMLAQGAVKQVVTWGLSDRYTSKSTLFPRPDGQAVRPLPFDSNLKAKPAALAMQDAFRSRLRP